MKILVAGVDIYNHLSSIVRSLQQLRHDVIFVNMIEFYKQCSYIERKLYKFGAKFLEKNYTKTWNEKFIDICDKFQPNLVLIINGEVFTHNTLQQLNRRGINTILWLKDSITCMREHESKLIYYNKICSFEEDDVCYLKNKYGLTSYYYPIGYDEEAYYPDATIKRDIDICFVGNPTGKRAEILQYIARHVQDKSLTMRVYGRWWDKKYFWKKKKFARKHFPLNKYILNGDVAATQIGELYRRSKICLNIHTPHHTGVNPRTFEILGTRSFELIDERKKTAGLIRPGVDLVMYTDVDDLLNKIDYYLANNKEREIIANNGYEWVKSRYAIKQIVENVVTDPTFQI